MNTTHTSRYAAFTAAAFMTLSMLLSVHLLAMPDATSAQLSQSVQTLGAHA